MYIHGIKINELGRIHIYWPESQDILFFGQKSSTKIVITNEAIANKHIQTKTQEEIINSHINKYVCIYVGKYFLYEY